MKAAFVAGRTAAGMQEKERATEEKRVTDAPVHPTEDSNPPFAWPHTQEHASPQSVLLLAVFSFFCPLEITESPWSLTPLLFEMKEEMTVNMRIFSPALNYPSQNYTFHPTFFLNYSLIHCTVMHTQTQLLLSFSTNLWC